MSLGFIPCWCGLRLTMVAFLQNLSFALASGSFNRIATNHLLELSS